MDTLSLNKEHLYFVAFRICNSVFEDKADKISVAKLKKVVDDYAISKSDIYLTPMTEQMRVEATRDLMPLIEKELKGHGRD